MRAPPRRPRGSAGCAGGRSARARAAMGRRLMEGDGWPSHPVMMSALPGDGDDDFDPEEAIPVRCGAMEALTQAERDQVNRLRFLPGSRLSLIHI